MSLTPMQTSFRQFAKRARRRLFEAVGDDRYSMPALEGLEAKLLRHMDWRDGTFIEAGANDGFTQSNTYWFERFRGWTGILVEPVPEIAAECRRNRPGAVVVNAALVADPSTTTVNITAGGLMSYVTGSLGDHEPVHRQQAESYQAIKVYEIEVPGRTLASLLERPVDFLSLDTEGYDIEALRGLDVARNRPKFILVEAAPDAALSVLGGHYRLAERLSRNDVLLTRI